MKTTYAWDEKKAASNFLKHGVSFEGAVEALHDPNQVVSENYFVDGEQRSQVIGMTRKMVLLLVVFVDRSSKDREVIHIISARKGEYDEERIYEEQIS